MIWIGLIALAAAALCVFLTRQANTRARSMESTETLTAQDLQALHEAAVGAAGDGSFRHRCEVVGKAMPHRDGVLKSQLEELDCVWHRHKITRKYEESYRDSDGNHQRRTRTEVLSEHTSSTPFFVEDATGRVVVHPGDSKVVGAEKVLDRFDQHLEQRGGAHLQLGPLSLNVRSGDGTLGYQRQEWIVRPGSFFYVHGEASDGRGGLTMGAPVEGGVFVLSVKSEEELLRGENNKVLGFGIGAGVLAVAGVVLLVLAALR